MNESKAAQFLVDTLTDCYKVPGRPIPDIWDHYAFYMRQQWRFSDREVEVGLLCIQGFSNNHIASKLEISAETVNKHVDNMFRKARVQRREQLSAELLEHASEILNLN